MRFLVPLLTTLLPVLYALATAAYARTYAREGSAEDRLGPIPLRPIWFELHTVTAVLGYSAFAVSAIYGILFLLLYSEIRANHFSHFFRRMPPLEALGQMNIRAAGGGLALLTLAIVLGVG